jgi:hypothetical protein
MSINENVIISTKGHARISLLREATKLQSLSRRPQNSDRKQTTKGHHTNLAHMSRQKLLQQSPDTN